MNCAIYARVSTADQNCELQLNELREYCARRDWTIGAEYVDKGWSGAKASRPELDKLMKHAGEHRFDCVLVWKLDRFGRSVMHLTEHLLRLNSQGIRFIASTQSIDTDQANPTSRLLLHILAAVAEFEREMIRERVKAGMTAARRRGVRCGRPKVTFDRQTVADLSARGMSTRQIARKLKVSSSTVHRVLLCQKAGENGLAKPLVS